MPPRGRRTGTTSFSASSATSSCRWRKARAIAPVRSDDAHGLNLPAPLPPRSRLPRPRGLARVVTPSLSGVSMNKRHDPELELFKRTVDLADYAKRAGYELRPQDGAPGLTVLDHPNRDRIVVGQHPNGPWVYASVPDYAPRAASEPAEHALARLRSAIHRSPDTGTVVEFVQQRDPWARRGDVPLDQVRDRLRSFRATRLPLDFEG